MKGSPSSKSTTPDTGATPIVGLGASAGGLEALGKFLAHVPASSGLAYVVVQHLDPTHKAMLVELLQRATGIPVREAAESMRVDPDVVYVIPPNTEMTVVRGSLHLAHPAKPRGLRLPIDVLFSSIARDLGERAIGVVLSGMGSDGTLGVQAIKALGGLTLAQKPESAQFDAMPSSAIASGCVDIVALPDELPARLLAVVAPALSAPRAAEAHGADHGPLSSILQLLRERSTHDLSMYKTSTLLRRIERRMAVHRLESVVAYLGFVRENPKELDLLFKELLIGVTAFFRDPAVWQELEDKAMPALFARRGGEPARLRAWVVGCSTGEEAYSLAIVFKEAIDALSDPNSCTIQIFATDLSADAIGFARKGLYPARIADSVAPERLARFFTPQDAGFLIKKDIRDMILFAQHDAILDPPFTKLDILSCRNLLIYFGAILQRRLIPLFHYSLRPGGLLVLGTSETVGRSQALFSPLDPKSRLYWRNDGVAGLRDVHFPVKRRPSFRSATQELNVSDSVSRPPDLQALSDQVLLQAFAPPAVLVNETGDILYINGRTGDYLEPAAGKANWNIHVMSRQGIRTQLAVALRTAVKEKKSVELRGLRLEDNGRRTLDVVVQYLAHPKSLEGMVLIVFQPVASTAAGKGSRKRPAGVKDPAVDEELARVREEVVALRQEMAASKEELQAANEELQSTNEELQSANEELTTSKEESQSMNEELQTINAELQSKLDDLALAQSDMQNLLNSIDIATLFLDDDLNVRRFTDKITRIVHLREADIGRPLGDLANSLVYPDLHADANETLRTLAPSEKQIPTTDGHWYTVRIMPYRTLANVIQGVVITFIDITTAKELEARLRTA